MTKPKNQIPSRRLMLWGASWMLASWFVSHVVVFSQPRFIEQIRAEEIAVIADRRINESSGIAMGLSNADCIWTHNDSGGHPRLFCVGMDGKTDAVVDVDGAEAYDWEDICSFRMDGASWLLIADVGDNQKQRGKSLPACRMYLVREPELREAARRDKKKRDAETVKLDVRVHATIEFHFDDGPWDCESVAVDVARNEILLVTKALPQNCALYTLPLSTKQGQSNAVAKRVASLAIPFATGMDVAAQSDRMVIVTPFNGLLIRRAVDEDWPTACRRTPVAITLPPRKQGEAVCFDAVGGAILVNSEFEEQPLWRVPLPAIAAAP